MKIRTVWLHRLLAALLCTLSLAVSSKDSVTVAYLEEWATPNLEARATGAFQAELGVTVTWQPFSNGAAMTQAMLDGNVDIAFSQGSDAFVAAVNAGAPLSAVAVAAAYPPGEDCIARQAPDFQSDVGDWLIGKSVALPLGTLAEFHYRQSLDVLGVEPGRVTVVDLDSTDAAAALVEGSVVMACGFGEGALGQMREVGASVLTPAQKRDAGLNRFDLVTVTHDFLQRSPERARAFLHVTDRANTAHSRGESDEAVIAAQAKLALSDAAEQLARMTFPTAIEQRGVLMGDRGALRDLLAFTGRLLATETHPALDDYATVVNSTYLP